MTHLLPRRPLPGLLGILAFLLLHPCAVLADWINLTGAETSPNIAEVYVLDDRVRLVLEVHIGDLAEFEPLIPDDLMKDTGSRPDERTRMARFAHEGIRIETDEGRVLEARVNLVEPRMRVDRKSPFAGMVNPVTGRRVSEAPADKRVLYAEIDYPFGGERPRALTITPPLDGEQRARATIGFIAYHKAVPVIDFRYLGAPARLELDWSDPWYTKFDNPNLKRHHKSALMTFLYVEPYEVRHEVLTRVKDLEAWMDIGLRDPEFIEVDELEAVKQRVAEFFLTRNVVRIDGEAATPILDRTEYVEVSTAGIRIVERPQRLEVSSAIVGVILAYLTQGIPDKVTVDWELFTDQIERVPATATDPAGPLKTILTRDDNVHEWTNFLKTYTLATVDQVGVDPAVTSLSVPLASVLLGFTGAGALVRVWRRREKRLPWLAGAAGAVALAVMAEPYAHVSVARPGVLAPALTDEQGALVLETVLKNVYRAYDFRDEETVYDKLALTVSGDLLADVYLQSRRSLIVKQAGGAQAKVKEVEVESASVTPIEDRAFAYEVRARWTALGTVGHWGHVHSRKNRYEADVVLDAVEGQWKITGLNLIEEQRIDPNAPPAGKTPSS